MSHDLSCRTCPRMSHAPLRQDCHATDIGRLPDALPGIVHAVAAAAGTCASRLLLAHSEQAVQPHVDVLNAVAALEGCGVERLDMEASTARVARSVLAAMKELSLWRQVKKPLDFASSCDLLRRMGDLKISDEMLAAISGMLSPEEQAAFRQELAALTNDEEAQPLLQAALLTVAPLAMRLRDEVLEMHSAPGRESVVPIALSMSSPDSLRSFCVGLQTDMDTLTDLARGMHDTALGTQVAFIRETHSVLQEAAQLRNAVSPDATVDDRCLTPERAQQVKRLQKELRSLSGKPDQTDVFAPQGKSSMRCTVLDSLFDGDAFLSETMRQSTKHLGEVVGLWVSDIIMVRDVLLKKCPVPGPWIIDASTVRDRELHAALLACPDFQTIGPTVELLQQHVVLLESLNVPQTPPLVSASDIDSMKAACKLGKDVVMVTFLVFLLKEKLPQIESLELRKAEVDATRQKLQARGCSIPAAFEEALLEQLVDPSKPPAPKQRKVSGAGAL